MLPEDAKDRREIGQLLYVANAYLDLAEEEKKGVKEDIVKKPFGKYQSKEEDISQNTLTSAHLASSAIRLCTIDEKLLNKYKDSKQSKDHEFRKKLYNNWLYVRNRQIESTDVFFHFILRNNVVHIEADRMNIPDTNNEMERKERYKRCQDEFLKSCIDDLYKKINNIRDAVTNDLKFFKLT